MTDDCSRLTQIDLNLMLVFIIVYESPSVSVAARRLGVGQPAVSNSLKKLRCLFDDPLFLRDGRGMSPTSKAHSLAAQISAALQLLQNVIL